MGIEVAIIGGAVIGAAASAHSANKASKAQKSATAAATTAEANQLAFQKEQYADWERVYGPIQDRLSSFYQNIDPTTFAAQGVQHLQQSHATQMQQIERTFAQRGIESPAQEAMQQSASLDLARGSAHVRSTAPMMMANAQQGFLNQNVANPAAQGIAGAYGQQAMTQRNAAMQFGQQAGQAGQAAGQAISGGVQSYFQHQAYQNQQAALNAAPAAVPPIPGAV